MYLPREAGDGGVDLLAPQLPLSRPRLHLGPEGRARLLLLAQGAQRGRLAPGQRERTEREQREVGGCSRWGVLGEMG